MSTEKQHSEQHEELLKKQALEQQEVKEVLVFIQKYAKPASIAIVVICVLILANRFTQSKRLQKEAKADAALMMARSPEDLQAVYENYGSTPTAPLALMELAKSKFNGGQIDAAEELYSTFIKKFSSHTMTAQAELNLIHCQEAKGQHAEAQNRYAEFSQSHKDNLLLSALSLIGQARCMETLQKYSEAKIVYEDIIVSYPDSSWAQIAEENLKILASKN